MRNSNPNKTKTLKTNIHKLKKQFKFSILTFTILTIGIITVSTVITKTTTNTKILTIKTINITNAQTSDTTPPTTPTNLTTTPTSDTQINLSWTASTDLPDNANAVGYNIYRCTGTSCTPTTLINTSTTNSYSDTGLTAETTYTYVVSAYDGSGNVSGRTIGVSGVTEVSTMVTGIIFEDNFDSMIDWQSQEKLTGEDSATVAWDLNIPAPFSDYRSSRGQLSSLGEHTFQINNKNFRGSNGKGLSCFYEAANNHVGGGLGIWLGETGYDELYLSFWMKLEDDFRFATIGGLGGTIFKLFRIMSNIDNPALKPNAAEPMNMYQTPWNRKPEWDDNTTPLNSSGEGGKQGYVILRWEQIIEQMAMDKLAYNPEGRAGSLADIHEAFDDGTRIMMKDYHLKFISSGGLATSSYAPADWVGNGQWVHYEIHVKHNDIGVDNALVELFLNGTKVATKSNFRLRNTLETKFNYIILPDNVYNMVYANTTPPAPPGGEQLFVIDDVVVSTEPIPDGYIIGNLSITTSTLQAGNENTSYSQTLSSQGGTSPYTYTLSSGTLPTGLSLSTTGIISGTPTTAGTYNFTVQVIDNISATDTQSLSIIINPADTTPPTLTNPQPTTTLPPGTTSTTLSITTNENSTCKYTTTANTPYNSITSNPPTSGTFTTTGTTTHSTTITGLTNGSSYNYYLRCSDTTGNVNTTDTTITFSISNQTYNLSNFTSLVTNWLGIGDSNSDINNDGVVNTRDLGIMMSSWE